MYPFLRITVLTTYSCYGCVDEDKFDLKRKIKTKFYVFFFNGKRNGNIVL